MLLLACSLFDCMRMESLVLILKHAGELTHAAIGGNSWNGVAFMPPTSAHPLPSFLSQTESLGSFFHSIMLSSGATNKFTAYPPPPFFLYSSHLLRLRAWARCSATSCTRSMGRLAGDCCACTPRTATT